MPPQLNLNIPYVKGRPLRFLDNDIVEYEFETPKGRFTVKSSIHESYEMSSGELYSDMCEMNVLNEPEVLNNLIQRYKQ